MSGYREFAVGEVLTSSNVNEFLMNQAVMRFADAAARGSALGTAVLAEGMVTYLDDEDEVQFYDGSSWGPVGIPTGTATPLDGQILAFGTATSTWNPASVAIFDSITTITATDASWSVPALASPIVKVTVIGGGGAGGGKNLNGGSGSASTFASSAGTATAAGGGLGQDGDDETAGGGGTNGFASGNFGQPASGGGTDGGMPGRGGAITVAYFDMTGVSTANVTIGAGGAGAGSPSGGDGGDGIVLFEYRAA